MSQRFAVIPAIKEVWTLYQRSQQRILCSLHLDIPAELELQGSRSKFQQVLRCLLDSAYQSYDHQDSSRIIMIVAHISDQQRLVVSVTDGGRGLGWLEQKLLNQWTLRLAENSEHYQLQLALHLLKSNFNAQMHIIAAKHRGTTVRCLFKL